MSERRDQTPDIQGRTVDYAVRAVRLFHALQAQSERAGWVMGRQFLRAAASIGANVAESQSGESRSDSVHKPSIAQNEARECSFWLQVMERTEILTPARLRDLKSETYEIIAVLAAIIKSTRGNKKPGRWRAAGAVNS
jgi:four helix bundle protein